MPRPDPALLAAIDQLSQLNREQPSSRLCGALLELRHRAALAMCQRATQDMELLIDAPAQHFESNAGLPEISANGLNQDSLLAGLHGHGALLVRGLFSEQQLERLRALLPEHEKAPEESDIPAGCAPEVLFELLEIYRECGLLNLVKQYHGGETLLFAERAKLRRHVKKRDAFAAIPWHQDVNFFGHKSFALNCWAAVSACGEDNPGLGIVPQRTERRHGWDGPGLAPLDYGKRMPEGTLEALTSETPAAYPVLQPGDAVLFDEMTVHGTASRPWKVKEQVVAISWVFRPSHFPQWGTPLLA